VVEIWLPYGKSEIPVRVPEERLVEILKPAKVESPPDYGQAAQAAFESSGSLLESAKAGRTCIVLGASSEVRLSTILIQGLVEKLLQVGAQQSSITLLRTPDAPELDSTSLGEVKVLVHNPISADTVPVKAKAYDFLPSVNSAFAEANTRILVGELKPHHFLGYSGLADIVFPGLASQNSAAGELSGRREVKVSQLHTERLEITASFNNLYAVGYVLGADQSGAKVVLSSFGNCISELKEAVIDVCSRSIERAADVVVMSAGGFPADSSLSTAVETLPAALPALKKAGVIIFAAECRLGHGDTSFFAWSAEHKEPRYLEARLKHFFNYDGSKAAFLSRTLEDHRIYLVSTVPDHYVESTFSMRAASTVNSALDTVNRSIGRDSTISVIPDASRILLTKAASPSVTIDSH
jgi:hypothetical protein